MLNLWNFNLTLKKFSKQIFVWVSRITLKGTKQFSKIQAISRCFMYIFIASIFYKDGGWFKFRVEHNFPLRRKGIKTSETVKRVKSVFSDWTELKVLYINGSKDLRWCIL